MMFEARLMTFCTMKRCSGDNDLSPFGFLQETRTQSISTNRLTNGVENTIGGLHDTNGVWCTNIGEIAVIAEAYYKGLFIAFMDLNIEDVLASIDSVVTEGIARSLTRSYTEEVQVALFQMHPSKSPDPDGMSPFFFQKFWHIVGMMSL